MRQPAVSSCARRGFSLIEAVTVVVVLAIAAPSTLRMMDAGVDARVDSVQANRATLLVTGLLEQIIADSHSDEPGLGFEGFADENAYLDLNGSGLWDRADGMLSVWDGYGIGAEVTIGPLSDAAGVVTGDLAEDTFRTITVTAVYDDAGGGEVRLPITVVLTGEGP